ncbi:hypothetical protein [Sphingobium baderi]|uniref:Uncharacterized protein n=1 Tax=Sphingobium baderi LL03 TaxID=1114964 RepID=T0GBA3_9SPHN|nr:hypothetical protein [Sphingobium baderi]EQA97921.1 hypothetical protein L485_19450 [Sphingobium baderi LL03]KMS63419.1 hypothetical protein V475_02680 [Sphingobium baderi LL03]
MPEAKPIASLTSGLLARKGAAQPAMRRPMLGLELSGSAALAQDDLGWNDMGGDMPVAPLPRPLEPSPLAGLTPMANIVPQETPVPAVIAERNELAERVADALLTGRRNAGASRKAAFTLRLDAERHLRLRLACAVEGRSAQQIVTDAVDKYLSGIPEIDRLAQQVPPMRGVK